LTVSTTTNRIAHTGNGSTTAFAFPNLFLTNADLKVYVDDEQKTLTTDYAVTGAGVAAGGTVTFVVAPALDASVVIVCDPDTLQSTRLPSNGPFPSGAVERMVDKVTLLIQRSRDQQARSAAFADSYAGGASPQLPVPQAGYGLAWNALGTALINIALTTGTSLVSLIASGGSALIGFIQSGVGAAARTLEDKGRESSFTVTDFMTAAERASITSGSLDVTAAWQKALAGAGLRTVSMTPVVGSFEVAAVIEIEVPPGIYKLTAPLTFATAGLSYVRIKCKGRAIIWQATAGQDIFDMRGIIRVECEGLITVGGKRHYVFGNANINGSQLTWDRCEFHNSSDFAIETVLTGAWGTVTNLSCHIRVTRSRFADCFKVMKNCEGVSAFVGNETWVQPGASMNNGEVFENRNELLFDRMYGVPPASGIPLLAHWVANYGQFYAKHSRFGGEDSGFPPVVNHAPPQSAYPYNLGGVVSIRDCFCAIGNTAGGRIKGMVILKAMPQLIDIQGNFGIAADADPYIVDDVPGTLAVFIASLGVNVVCYVNVKDNVGHVPLDSRGVPAALLNRPDKVRFNCTPRIEAIGPNSGPDASLYFSNYASGIVRQFRLTAGQEGLSVDRVTLTDVSNARVLLQLFNDAEIASGATTLVIRRNVGGTFSEQQVSMGAADSGGAGYKLLRVPN
jgi:hypothetical protein